MKMTKSMKVLAVARVRHFMAWHWIIGYDAVTDPWAVYRAWTVLSDATKRRQYASVLRKWAR